VLIVGNSNTNTGNISVGKTSIAQRYINPDLTTLDFKTTVALDVFSVTREWRGRIAKISLWDTAGHDRFRYEQLNMEVHDQALF
jgi:GTPase SAR1 family protein